MPGRQSRERGAYFQKSPLKISRDSVFGFWFPTRTHEKVGSVELPYESHDRYASRNELLLVQGIAH